MVPLPVFCKTRISRTCLDSAGFDGDGGSVRFAAVWISVDRFLRNPAQISRWYWDTAARTDVRSLSTTLSNYQTTRKQL